VPVIIKGYFSEEMEEEYPDQLANADLLGNHHHNHFTALFPGPPG